MTLDCIEGRRGGATGGGCGKANGRLRTGPVPRLAVWRAAASAGDSDSIYVAAIRTESERERECDLRLRA